MEEKLVHWLVKWWQHPFIKIAEKTFHTIFPFVLIGSFSHIIQIACFSKEGYFNQLFAISTWLPHFSAWRYSFASLSMVTYGIVALLVAYQMAYLHSDKQNSIAGLTGLVSFMLISAQYYKSPTFTVKFDVFNYDHLFFALIVGYSVGKIFDYFEHHQHKRYPSDEEKFYRLFRPVLCCIFLAFILNKLWILAMYFLPNDWSQQLMNVLNSHVGTFGMMIYASITTLCSWLGIGIGIDNYAPNRANLAYALNHHSATNYPHPYDAYTWNGYMILATLGLSIALVLVAQKHQHRMIGGYSLLTTMFNSNAPLYVGMPLIFNPLYLLPLLIVPLINIGLASLGIWIGFIKSSVYPIPQMVISLFVPFMETAGSWQAFVWSCVILFVDVCCYIPIVHLSEKVDIALKEWEDDYEKS